MAAIVVPRRPDGYDGVCKVFGDIVAGTHSLTRIDLWEASMLVTLPLSVKYPYIVDGKLTYVTRVRAHKLLARHIVDLLEKTYAICNGKYEPERWSFGGCYAFRTKRTASGRVNRISLHAWGIAVDIGPLVSPIGKAWSNSSGVPYQVVELWRDHKWVWGGTWASPDSMHFQFATRY